MNPVVIEGNTINYTPPFSRNFLRILIDNTLFGELYIQQQN